MAKTNNPFILDAGWHKHPEWRGNFPTVGWTIKDREPDTLRTAG